MKKLKDFEEPWKKKEPGARLSRKARESQEHFEMQRKKMEKNHTLRVRITCHKSLLLPGLFRSFTVRVNIPLRKKEINKRMAAAFPECEWRDS